jgi:hypothetical protein
MYDPADPSKETVSVRAAGDRHEAFDETEAKITASALNYSSTTCEQFFSKWCASGITSLKRDELQAQMLNRTIIWTSVVRGFSPADSAGVQISAEYGLGAVFIRISESQCVETTALMPGDTIRYTGAIRRSMFSAVVEETILLRVGNRRRITEGAIAAAPSTTSF